MYHRAEQYGTGVYDVPPAPSGVVFPSEVRQSYSGGADEYRPRSQSADTGRYSSSIEFASSNRRRPFVEEHHDDYPGSGIVTYGAASAGSSSLNNSKLPSPPPRQQSHYVNFPSSIRENQSIPGTSTVPSGSTHNFTQHLRERSPSSSSALLNLLQRYPSARQSVYNEANKFLKSDSKNSSLPNYQDRSTFVSSNATLSSLPSSYPAGSTALLHENSAIGTGTLPKPSPAASRRTYSLPTTETWSIPSREQPGLASSYHSEYRSSPVSSKFYESPQSIGPLSSHAQQQQQPQQLQPYHQHHSQNINQRVPIPQTEKNQNFFGSTQTPSTPYYQNIPSSLIQDSEFNYRSQPSHKFYSAENNNINNLPLSNHLGNSIAWPDPTDITQLDSLLKSVLLLNEDADMNRSTNEWRNSFAQMKEKFRNIPFEDQGNGFHHSFTSSGAPTLPRRSGPLLSKSSSHHDVPESSLLAKAVTRRASEAPDHSRSGAIDTFWSTTVASRPQSPTIQRLPTLTAAERLQMLQEPTNGPSNNFRGSVEHLSNDGKSSLAARRDLYMNGAANSGFITSNAGQLQDSGSVTSPNFTELDSAVKELGGGVRSTGYSHSARRLGGCARFPTDEHAFSPPRQAGLITNHFRLMNSPSPSDTASETSSVYQVPTGLPHPKPKHNIKEQLHQLQQQQQQINGYYPRSGLVKTSPNFPVPTTGSVASRITEFEKRPGTPTLHVLNVSSQEKIIPTSNSMSPKSSVFRAKPVIHVDLGSHHTRSPHHEMTAIEFQEKGTQSWNESADLNATPVSSLTRDLKKLDLNSPHATTVRYSRRPPFRRRKYRRIDCQNLYGRKSMTLVCSPNYTTNAIFFDPNSAFAHFTISNKQGENSLFNDSHEEPYSNHVNKLCLEDSFSGTSDSSNSLDNSKVGRGLNASKSFRLLDESLTAEPEKEYDGFIPRSQKPRTLINYPKFHFPQGKPVSQYENDAALKRVCEVFRSLPNQACSSDQMGEVCEAAGIPLFWKKPLFLALVRKENRLATLMDFTAFWRAMTGVAHDEAARFVYTLTAGEGSHLTRKDFIPLVMDVIHSHPGLEFYRSSVEFHDKFCDVVISRIFWNVHRPWAHSLTAQDIRKSDLLEKIRDLQTDEDINKNFRYFSYEHFYVIYCNFWELDTNHDMLINRSDLERHGKYAIPRVIVDRIFSGAIRPASKIKIMPDYIDISEYTYFLLADEDKNHPMSIEYWFRIIDLDGDGLISFYDMEYFHNFVIDALSQEGIETLKFEDVVCHLIDAVNPKNKNSFKLADLKGNKMAPKFFNSLVNWRKFYHQETNEVSEARVEDESGRELTDWDRYCVEEYEALMDTTNDEDGVENFEVHLEDDDEIPTTSYTDLL